MHRSRYFFAAMAAFICGTSLAHSSDKASSSDRPMLRIGLVFAPAKSIYFVTKDADGNGEGVTADLAQSYSEYVDKAVEEVLYPNSGEVSDALESGEIDISFMPSDASRKARFDFGPTYVFAESTYMVTKKSGIKSLADLDRPNLRILAVTETSTMRAAQAALKVGTVTPVASVKEAIVELREGQADAFALSRDSLPAYLSEVPGATILDEAFQRVPIAIVVRKGDEATLKGATEFMTQAKHNGTVRNALDRAGFTDQPVAE